MRFVEPLMAKKKKELACFAFSSMRHLDPAGDIRKKHELERPLSAEDVKVLQGALLGLDAIDLFKKFGLSHVKEFFETKLDVFIKSKSYFLCMW
jgi:hypothetical protein